MKYLILFIILLLTSCTSYEIDETTTIPNSVVVELKSAEPVQEYIIEASGILYRFDENKQLIMKHWIRPSMRGVWVLFMSIIIVLLVILLFKIQ